MEFLLLWADELDDVVGVLRHYTPRILRVLGAIAIFAVTGFALTHMPAETLAAIGLN